VQDTPDAAEDVGKSRVEVAVSVRDEADEHEMGLRRLEPIVAHRG
jgi:hypothetical protein